MGVPQNQHSLSKTTWLCCHHWLGSNAKSMWRVADNVEDEFGYLGPKGAQGGGGMNSTFHAHHS